MKKVALVVGHKVTSRGASNKSSGMTEFDFNSALAKDIKEIVSGVYVDIVYRRTYRQLPDDINNQHPDFIISLHCNAFDCEATGTETLYYYKSSKGKKIAAVLQNKIVKALGLADRGLKPRGSEGRGGYLLRYTKAPIALTEAFFIDNDHDLSIALKHRDSLVAAYAEAIEEIAGTV